MFDTGAMRARGNGQAGSFGDPEDAPASECFDDIEAPVEFVEDLDGIAVIGAGAPDRESQGRRLEPSKGPSLRAVATRAGGGVDALDAVAGYVAPRVLAGDQRYEVSDALSHVLPEGIQRGSTVGVVGPGAASLAMAVAAGPTATGSWMAMVGCDDISLVGVEQAGVALHQTIVVSQPPRESWGGVVAALVDAFDVVAVSSPSQVSLRDARRLLSRVRDRGGILIDVGDCWPEAHDIELRVHGQRWSGLGQGHGVLTARQVQVTVAGRRGTRSREVPLWLPGPDAVPAAIDPDHRHAGADIDLITGDGDVVPLRKVI